MLLTHVQDKGGIPILHQLYLAIFSEHLFVMKVTGQGRVVPDVSEIKSLGRVAWPSHPTFPGYVQWFTISTKQAWTFMAQVYFSRTGWRKFWDLPLLLLLLIYSSSSICSDGALCLELMLICRKRKMIPAQGKWMSLPVYITCMVCFRLHVVCQEPGF